MIPSELLRKVRQIQIRTKRVVNDLFAGQYHSAFRGRGMEFEEVTPYQIGDDVRSIDWNVSARYGQPFVKRFREEREQTVLLLVDVSRSGFVGSTDRFAVDVAAELCAVVALSAIRNNDKVGLILFTDRVEKYVPAKKGSSHVLRIIRELLYFQPEGHGTNVGEALGFLQRVSTRKTICFMVSDFLGRVEEFPLRIARKRHDLIPVVVSDPRLRELPRAGFVDVEDAESGQRMVVDCGSRAVREAYRKQQEVFYQRRKAMFRRLDVTPIEVHTERSYVEPLVRFFRERERRRAR